MSRSWFVSTSGWPPEQGEIVFNCLFPVLQVQNAKQFEEEVATGEVAATLENRDAVILTQSCDLAESKAPIVLLAPFEPWGQYKETAGGKEKATWKDLRAGRVVAKHLLDICKLPDGKSDYLVVDFRFAFGVPFEVLQGLCVDGMDRPKLISPYREHLSQSFARFFMRVGLPQDLPDFEELYGGS